MQILIVQTAFIGDVVLATALAEKIKAYIADAEVDYLVRSGNEGVLEGNPNVRRVLVWDKQRRKLAGLLQLIRRVRAQKYDCVVNLHRYFSSGLLVSLSGADHVVGFRQNPLSWFFNERLEHVMDGQHEIARNQQLIAALTDEDPVLPKMYIDDVKEHIRQWQTTPYVTISPGSVWYTKQVPIEKWVALINGVDTSLKVYLLGGPADRERCEEIAQRASREKVTILAGKLSMRASAALMQGAAMNYTNDSAPLHFASAVNAPTCAVFCSTTPRLGFGPLSADAHVVEVTDLACKPCGKTGKSACPEGHFRCGRAIETEKLLEVLHHSGR